MPLPFPSIRELLSGFSEAESGWIHSLCIERRFLRNAEVFRQGDPPDGVCAVKKGFLKIVSISEKGTEQILHILRPGDVFGELILIGKPRPFTAVALTDAIISILPLAVLQDLLASSPVFSRNYLRLLSTRLYELEQTFPALVQAWPHHRLAKELLHLAEDLGDETPEGTRLTLRITHELLSNLIGASRETVTLLIHKFEEIGLLRREGRDLFLNRERLADYLGLEGE
ncbi:MAG: Crp/Fnr family transcriptional regulator [Deltaproteobacteria bacterium]|nr:Crp/Fnr family transcriptional regulator [Candidatus Deferrimicrobium borealis]